MTAHNTHPALAERATRQLARSLLDEAVRRLGDDTARLTAPSARLAGSEGQRGHPVVWDRVTIPAALRAFQAREGRAPTRNEWRQASRHQLPARATVGRVYGTLDAVYLASGLVAPGSRQGKTPGTRGWSRGNPALRALGRED